jgi:hypothetical protein
MVSSGRERWKVRKSGSLDHLQPLRPTRQQLQPSKDGRNVFMEAIESSASLNSKRMLGIVALPAGV